MEDLTPLELSVLVWLSEFYESSFYVVRPPGQRTLYGVRIRRNQ